MYWISFLRIYKAHMAQDSSVCIANSYGHNGPGIEFRWRRDFPLPSRTALETIQPPIQWVPGLFPGVKTAGAWRWPPTPSIAEVKERVELYLYSPSGSSWPVLGRNLPFTLTFYPNSTHLSYNAVAGNVMSYSSNHLHTQYKRICTY